MAHCNQNCISYMKIRIITCHPPPWAQPMRREGWLNISIVMQAAVPHKLADPGHVCVCVCINRDDLWSNPTSYIIQCGLLSVYLDFIEMKTDWWIQWFVTDLESWKCFCTSSHHKSSKPSAETATSNNMSRCLSNTQHHPLTLQWIYFQSALRGSLSLQGSKVRLFQQFRYSHRGHGGHGGHGAGRHSDVSEDWLRDRGRGRFVLVQSLYDHLSHFSTGITADS